jgi:hypothetical protein
MEEAMPRRTLAERLERAARRKARAEQEAAKLKLMQRKERTRRLIEIGGLAAKAGIDGLSTAALYDRFLVIADEAKDRNAVLLWERTGGRHFHHEEEDRVVAVARFGGKLPKQVSDQLRALGFHWNRLLVQWEGKVDFDGAKAFVEGQGGEIRLVPAKPDSGTVPRRSPPAPR